MSWIMWLRICPKLKNQRKWLNSWVKGENNVHDENTCIAIVMQFQLLQLSV